MKYVGKQKGAGHVERDQLTAMSKERLSSLCRNAGIDPVGMSKEQMIAALLANM